MARDGPGRKGSQLGQLPVVQRHGGVQKLPPQLPPPRQLDPSWLGDPISTTQVPTDCLADLQIQVPQMTRGLCPRLSAGRAGGHGWTECSGLADR